MASTIMGYVIEFLRDWGGAATIFLLGVGYLFYTWRFKPLLNDVSNIDDDISDIAVVKNELENLEDRVSRLQENSLNNDTKVLEQKISKIESDLDSIEDKVDNIHKIQLGNNEVIDISDLTGFGGDKSDDIEERVGKLEDEIGEINEIIDNR